MPYFDASSVRVYHSCQTRSHAVNATCPRCGAVALVGTQATRFTCKTCRLRFCHECQHWKVNRKQSYCANCGAPFTVPPPVMPPRVAAVVLYPPLLAALVIAPLLRLQFWQIMLIAIALPVIYTSTYLALFYRRTGLTQATRREVILLIRRALTLATVIYIVVTLGNQSALIVGLIIAAVLVVIGLNMRQSDAKVIKELQANRPVWGAILAMTGREAFLMQFPAARKAQ
jgi:ribosomal protein S27AE